MFAGDFTKIVLLHSLDQGVSGFDWQIVWIAENITAIKGNEYQMKAAA